MSSDLGALKKSLAFSVGICVSSKCEKWTHVHFGARMVNFRSQTGELKAEAHEKTEALMTTWAASNEYRAAVISLLGSSSWPENNSLSNAFISTVHAQVLTSPQEQRLALAASSQLVVLWLFLSNYTCNSISQSWLKVIFLPGNHISECFGCAVEGIGVVCLRMRGHGDRRGQKLPPPKSFPAIITGF